MRNKKTLYFCLVLTVLALAGSFTGNPGISVLAEESESEGEDDALADETVAGWHIVVEDMQVSDSLENVSVSLGYTGVETNDFSMAAEDGDTFCLLKLLIEKDGSTEIIDWESMILTDEEDNEYFRMEDDFISDLGMNRMPGTSLNFGSNEGWIAYEIPDDASGLVLTYKFDEDTFTCELPEQEK